MSDISLPLRLHADTHTGLVHHKNEDSFAILPTPDDGVVLMVCDGMGGMGRGDVASRIAIASLTEELGSGRGFPPERLRRAIATADLKVREELCQGDRGLPGSTAVLVYVLGGLAHVAWVGDSRAYLIRGTEVLERTRDHKLVEELIDAGELTREQAKASTLAHVVTRALGGRSFKEPPVPAASMGHPWPLKHGDIVLVCSDGVCDLIDDDEIGGIIAGKQPDEAVQALIDVVLERGAHDNTTAIIAIWDGPDTEDLPEDSKETPMFAPSRADGPDDEDTDPGRSTWDDVSEAVAPFEPEDGVEADDDNITLVPGPDLDELLQRVQTAQPEPTDEVPRPAPTEGNEAPAEPWKIAVAVVLATALLFAAFYAVRSLTGSAG